MFDREISGEPLEHRDFIYNTAIPKLESWGYPVTVLRSKKTYIEKFYQVRQTGKRAGMRYGFPMQGNGKGYFLNHRQASDCPA